VCLGLFGGDDPLCDAAKPEGATAARHVVVVSTDAEREEKEGSIESRHVGVLSPEALNEKWSRRARQVVVLASEAETQELGIGARHVVALSPSEEEVQPAAPTPIERSSRFEAEIDDILGGVRARLLAAAGRHCDHVGGCETRPREPSGAAWPSEVSMHAASTGAEASGAVRNTRSEIPSECSRSLSHGPPRPQSEATSTPGRTVSGASDFRSAKMRKFQRRTSRKCSTKKLEEVWDTYRQAVCMATSGAQSRSSLWRSKSNTPPARRFCQGIWNAPRFVKFEAIMGILIVLNTVSVGLSTEWRRDWSGWVVVDFIFAAIFTVELTVKWRRQGTKEFFSSEVWMANTLDFVLVVLAWAEIVVVMADTSTESDKSGFSLSAVRSFRLLRIARIFRMARLPMFTELIMMLDGALGGFRALLWSQMLIALFLYIVALILRELVGTEILVDDALYFQTLPSAFFTSFRCLVASDCTDSSGRPIFVELTKAYGWHTGAIYSIACVLITFGLFNVIVAIFVENTVAAARHNTHRIKQLRLLDSKRFQRKALELVNIVLQNTPQGMAEPGITDKMTSLNYEDVKSILITPEIFEALLVDPDFREILRDLDIPDEEHIDLFDTFDIDGGGTLDLEELIQGIWKLRGDARRSDMVSVGLMVRNLQVAIHQLEEKVAEQQRG